MRRKIIYIFLLLAFVEMHAQNLKGVWFAGYNLKIDKYAGVEEFQIDSTYSIEGSVLDFYAQNKFHIKSVGGELATGNYVQKGDSLFLNLDEFKWKGAIQNEKLKLVLIDSSDYSLELFYDKLKPSNISSSSLINTEKLLASHWNINFEEDEVGLTFLPLESSDVLGKGRVFVSCATKNNIGTSQGNYLLDFYKNHLFVYLLDGGKFEEKMLYLNNYSNGIYGGALYEVGYLNNEISSKKASLTSGKFLAKEARIKAEKQLEGRYQLKLLNLNEQETSTNIKTIISYLELFVDHTFDIDEYITEHVNDTDVLRKTQKKGTWELSASGKFITLKFDNAADCYLTIRNENNKMVLYMSGNPFPEEEHLEFELKYKRH